MWELDESLLALLAVGVICGGWSVWRVRNARSRRVYGIAFLICRLDARSIAPEQPQRILGPIYIQDSHRR